MKKKIRKCVKKRKTESVSFSRSNSTSPSVSYTNSVTSYSTMVLVWNMSRSKL